MIVLLAMSLSIISAKTINSHIVLSDNEPWKALTNFGADIGSGNYTFRARMSTPLQDRKSEATVQLMIYVAKDWNEKLLAKSCEEKAKLSKKTFEVSLSGNTEWSVPVTGKITQKSRPQVWIFVLSDCSRSLGSRKIKYEFSIVNPNNSHFSIEMQGVKSIYGVLIVALILGLGRNVYQILRFFRNKEEVQGPVIWINVSIFFQIISLMFYYIHLWVYENDGEGLGIFKFFGDAFSLISSLSIYTLFIVIAGGWTLTHTDFPLPELYIPAVFLFGFTQLLLAGFSYMGESQSQAFTKFEGVLFWLIIFVELIMFLWFLWNLFDTLKDRQVKKFTFLYKFGIGASLYFLSTPILLVGTNVFPPYLAEKVMIVGKNLAQAIAFYFLFWIFTGKGDYHKINSIFSMLPGMQLHTY